MRLFDKIYLGIRIFYPTHWTQYLLFSHSHALSAWLSRAGLTTDFYLAKIQAQGTLPKRLNLRCVILKNHSQYYYSLLQPNTTSIFIFRILTPNVHKAYWHVKQPAGLYHEYFNTKTTIAWIIIFAPKRWCRIYGFLNQTFYIFNFYWIC